MQTADYPEVPDDFGHWLAGFIDGEGYFTIGHNRGLGTYYCRFGIGLRDDDLAVLREIQEVTGLGRIRAQKRVVDPRGIDAKPGAQWFVENRASCERLIQLLNTFQLRAKKRRDFLMWSEAVRVWGLVRRGAGRDWNSTHWRRMAELKSALAKGRIYHPSVLLREPLDDYPVPTGRDLPLF